MYTIDQSKIDDICSRVYELKRINDPARRERQRIRDIMNGGPKAVTALLGNKAVASNDRLPVANLMLSANTRLAQKLGRKPDSKVDPPFVTDSERALKAAEKRGRIVETLDTISKLDMLLPQVGRWLPGYGFVCWEVRQGYAANGDPYPIRELWDPYATLPGEWGAGQQPGDVALCQTIAPSTLARMYPEHADKILDKRGGITHDGGYRGGEASWTQQSGGGIEWYRYLNREGSWCVLPEKGLLLSHVPNILSRPTFHVMKRFAFDALVGQYDHVIGLMAAMARLNLLLIIATEDSVMAETVIVGDLAQGNQWHRGRNAVNFLMPGSSADRMNTRVPFEAFNYMSNLERQLRVVAGYAVTDDAQHPGGGWATGQGLQELKSEVNLEVREYFTVIQDGLVELDAICLEWDERHYGPLQKTMYGVQQGAPYEETYTPASAIKGNHRTRRVYGAMAGVDEPTKILTLLQLLQGELIDDITAMEQIDGLENHTKIRERIRYTKAEKVVTETLLAMAAQGDPKALAAAIEMLPESDWKELLTGIFLEQQDEQPMPMEAPPSEPEDVGTVLARLSAGPSGVTPTLSAQTVSTV